MKVRNKSLRTWTILGGAVAGMVGGVLIAKNSKEEGVYSTTAVILGFLLGGGVGAVAGVIVASSVEKKYLINGDWKSFEDLKAVLKY